MLSIIPEKGLSSFSSRLLFSKYFLLHLFLYVVYSFQILESFLRFKLNGRLIHLQTHIGDRRTEPGALA